MRKYAIEHTSTLLRRLAFHMSRVSRSGDSDSIHDLRVAIRRFTQSLRVFAPFFPKSQQKNIKRRLREIMDAAGEVRNRDITTKLVKKAGQASASDLLKRISSERKQSQQTLVRLIRRWREHDDAQKWRARLGL
jgi:CHAD domain-containing protein